MGGQLETMLIQKVPTTMLYLRLYMARAMPDIHLPPSDKS